ncbi:2-C-methyl-D-erythritol 4-phosphate cytidylyltransferase [Peptoniphilus sp. KCTC 25270]|uniref:2-C-methyl-D-erythritol 4-phosphate cytidylyltransferase n=1 Tax=Peptoniphilus sp. KCTC 25270 TaxID=2897414 RepID=UPI001E4C9020|nr:2-C-methyl-D-erythritol 4-phosphate cytidylyltransferase [Peptoniphilus sp. KCTC 25270]MCD1147024.1 2-C-methyl-D-erythritol 4-phosphate cytidylyltransferase [Peptoniphilus sp. KCTC 25270]
MNKNELNNVKIVVYIAAAGMGRRMNSDINKQFIPINGRPMIQLTLEKFDELPYIDEIFLIIREGEEEMIQSILNQMELSHEIGLVVGGNERQDSIYEGIKRVPQNTEIVLTHDGARPFVQKEEIEEIICSAIKYGAATLMTPMKDTVKISEDGVWSKVTPDRSKLFAVQTPQGFKKDILLKAYQQAFDEKYYGTDDCSLVEKAGYRIKLVQGSYHNIKITTPEDLILAEVIDSKSI